MPRLLIYDASPPKAHEALLHEVATSRAFEHTYTTDPELFESALAQRNHSLCLVLIGAEPAPELVELLGRARDHGRFDGALSLHASLSPTGIRAMLTLGVREVFVAPVAPARVVASIRAHLGGTHLAGVPLGALRDVPPVPVELRSFGRVGRLSTRPGELLVETHLTLDAGDEVALVDPFGGAFGVQRVTFRVAGRGDREPGCTYPYAYWLYAPSDPRVLAGWSALLDRLRDHFVQAKPRVLWITDRRLAEVERWLSPAAYAVRVCRPSDATPGLLARVEPSVVVVDGPATTAQGAVARAAVPPVVLQTPRATGDQWPVLSLDPAGFTRTWAEHAAHAPAPTKSEILYLSRGAPASRCAFSHPGFITAVGSGGFELTSALRVCEHGLVEVSGETLLDRGSIALFGRVLDMRADSHQVARLRCEALPVTDDPSLSPLRAGRNLQATTTPLGFSRSARSAPTAVPAPAEPAFSAPIAVGGALLLALMAGLGYAAGRREPPVAQGKPASTEAVLQGIREALDE